MEFKAISTLCELNCNEIVMCLIKLVFWIEKILKNAFGVQ